MCSPSSSTASHQGWGLPSHFWQPKFARSKQPVAPGTQGSRSRSYNHDAAQRPDPSGVRCAPSGGAMQVLVVLPPTLNGGVWNSVGAAVGMAVEPATAGSPSQSKSFVEPILLPAPAPPEPPSPERGLDREMDSTVRVWPGAGCQNVDCTCIHYTSRALRALGTGGGALDRVWTVSGRTGRAISRRGRPARTPWSSACSCSSAGPRPCRPRAA